VLTPHDGEYRLLTGRLPGPDRVDDARRLAAEQAAVVLLKGPTTVVAEPGGRALLVTEGDSRLATAGTGDVLSGMIGALLAQGVGPAEAAAAGAWLHGRAARRGPDRGLVAGDLPDLVAAELASGPGEVPGPPVDGPRGFR
jgi:NAD(P)H-hydrate epimerase